MADAKAVVNIDMTFTEFIEDFELRCTELQPNLNLIINSGKTFFESIKNNLSNSEIDELFTKIKSLECCYNVHSALIKIIGFLTKKHLLLKRQFDKLLKILIRLEEEDDDDDDDVDDHFKIISIQNLMNLGQKFSEKQLVQIYKFFPKIKIENLFNNDTGTMEDLCLICETGDIETIIKFIEKFNLVPDTDCFEEIIRLIYDSSRVIRYEEYFQKIYICIKDKGFIITNKFIKF